MQEISRRRFVQGSVGVLAGIAALGRSRVARGDWQHRWNQRTDPSARGLTGYLNHGNLFVRLDNLPLLGYRAHPTLKYPYFAPLPGPGSGLPLTTESALPYPHHRSLWLGCEPMDGGDYWGDGELSRGQIRSLDLQMQQTAEVGTLSFTDHCLWEREGGEPPLEDRRTFRVHIPNGRLRVLDCHFIITARKDLEIGRAKHSFFAVRCAPDIAPTYGGTLVNSEGHQGAEGTYGKPAKWCSYFGPRRLRPDVVEGIAIMDHPENFGGNCPWFTRDYGHLSPQPFLFRSESYRMARGQTLDLQYRVVLHAGDPKEAGLDSLYRKWT